MIERRAARFVADRAAGAAAEPVPVLVAARRTSLLNTRHIVPGAEAPLDRQNGGPWIV